MRVSESVYACKCLYSMSVCVCGLVQERVFVCVCVCLDVQRYGCFLSVGGGDCLGHDEKSN